MLDAKMGEWDLCNNKCVINDTLHTVFEIVEIILHSKTMLHCS